MQILFPLLVCAALLALWQIVSDELNARRVREGLTTLEIVIPSPRAIAAAFGDRWSVIQSAMWATMTKAGAGFAGGAIFALMIASAFVLMPRVRNASMPFAYAFNAFPVIGLVPAVVLAFGQGTFLSIAAIAGLISYFPILLTLDSALTRIDPAYLELAEVYDVGKLKTLKFIRAPLALPALLTSLRLAAPASIVGATIGEWMGSNTGIGNLITVALYQLQPGLLYACLIEIAVIAGLIALCIELAEFRWAPWHRQGHAR